MKPFSSVHIAMLTKQKFNLSGSWSIKQQTVDAEQTGFMFPQAIPSVL